MLHISESYYSKVILFTQHNCGCLMQFNEEQYTWWGNQTCLSMPGLQTFKDWPGRLSSLLTSRHTVLAFSLAFSLATECSQSHSSFNYLKMKQNAVSFFMLSILGGSSPSASSCPWLLKCEYHPTVETTCNFSPSLSQSLCVCFFFPKVVDAHLEYITLILFLY